MLASGAVSLISFIFSARSHDLLAWTDLKIVLYSNAVVLGFIALSHLIRTPYLVHAETIKHMNSACNKRLEERDLKPDFQTTVMNVVRVTLDVHFTVLVRVCVVNMSLAPSSIKRFRLSGTKDNQVHESVYFKKASLPTSQTEESRVQTENGVSYGQKRVMVDLRNLIGESKEDMWVRYAHKEGWLCFQGVRFDEVENQKCSVSLEIEDAAGGLHTSGTQVCLLENKVVFW